MRPQAPLLVQPATFGLVAAGGLAGCVGLFGYEYPSQHCDVDSDCPGAEVCRSQFCTPPCSSPLVECAPERACSADNVCHGTDTGGTDSGGTDSGGTDSGGTDSGGTDSGIAGDSEDAQAGTACGDVSNDPTNCGHCGAACASGVCEEASCLTIETVGPYLPGGTRTGNLVHLISNGASDGGYATLAGIIVHTDTQATLVRLGMLAGYGGVRGYLGLYTSVDGHPGELVVSTSEFTVQGDPKMRLSQTTEVDVPYTPVRSDTDYWILGSWQSDIYFEQLDDVATPACNPATECVAWYMAPFAYGPLPATAPQDELSQDPEPILYAIVAQ